MRAYISVGSNIEPEKNLPAALDLLKQRVRVTAVSTVYRTAPLGDREQPDFLNAVWQVETELPPHELKAALGEVEDALGRERSAGKYAPRTIDLDLILYGDETAYEADLKLPHPDLSRPFVGGPLLELAADIRLPGTGRPLAPMISGRGDRAIGEPQERLTQLLRARLEP